MNEEICVVLGKQTWKIKPDRKMMPENPCLWMQSGVVKFKECKNDFDCITCKYDNAMGKKKSWQDAMRLRGGMDRTCRHTLTGRIEGRICAINYECSKCDFDQMFEDYMERR